LTQFAGVGLADDYRARRFETPNDLGVVADGRDLPLSTESGWVSGNVDVVFDRDRNTQQRGRVTGGSSSIGVRRSGQRRLVEHHPESVQCGLAGTNRLQGTAHQLLGRN
jgi:hypothetical protein